MISGRRVKPMWIIAAIAVLGILSTACFPKQGSYPIEVFTEMHYSQSFKAQEPPRLNAVRGAEVFVAFGTDGVLAMTERQERAYDPATAAELYRVNCSVCHGVGGKGDGAINLYLTAADSYYASQKGEPYPNTPPNLLDSSNVFPVDGFFAFMSSNGPANVMPDFDLLLSEEDRWDIVNYVYDTERGLSKR
jgi:mono/diheme cytochrome c family protein